MGAMPKRTSTEQYDLVLERGVAQSSKRKSKDNRGSQTSWYYFGVVGQIGFSIALPIAGGALGGSYLDSRYGSYPRWTLGLLSLGIVISFITFYQTIKTVLKNSKGR